MPHKGNNKKTAAADGASLLLSLAETATKQVKHLQKDERQVGQPVTPSPSSRAASPSVKVVLNGAAISSSPIAPRKKPTAGDTSAWRRPAFPYGPYLHQPPVLTETAPNLSSSSTTQKRIVSDSSLTDESSRKEKRARPNVDDNSNEQPIISPTSSTDLASDDEQKTASATTAASATPDSKQPVPHTFYATPSPHLYGAPFFHPPYYPPYMPYYGMMQHHPRMPFPPWAAQQQQQQQPQQKARPGAPPSSSSSSAAQISPDKNASSSDTIAKASATSRSAPDKADSEPKTGVELLTAAANSTNRCVPLKQPVPRYWQSDVEAAEKVTIPDFSALVNFPDYISRGRAAVKRDKKPCVMCGQMRVCSANSMLRDSTTSGESVHIIPRQNKGVCTACDVTVWLLTTTSSPSSSDDSSHSATSSRPLEIKWCKGCKNFRAWAAFGEKGMATKCVRCRTRQKEKYAATKILVRKV